MLSVEKEEKVRALIFKGMLTKEISNKTKVSPRAVKRVMGTVKLTRLVSKTVRDRISCLSVSGYPAEAVSVKLGISVDVVVAVRNYYYLRTNKANRKKAVPLCDMCKDYIEANRQGANYSREPTLLSVAEDIAALDRLGILGSPLFTGIASRARAAIKGDKGNDT